MIRFQKTGYNGTWFRSRLEARWAVFMDFIGVRDECMSFGAVVATGIIGN
nr:hypothetical protein [uncultured Pseudodesulfovibrio sp.]